ncbi:MAG: GHKL domain-containing protein [Clostridia bacterium]|nr:GHKL domain-containing protein [Clostridia bacterium]
MNLMQILTNENPILIRIITVISTIVQAFLYYRIFSIFLKVKSTSKQKKLFILILSICSIVVMFLPTSILKDLLTIIPFLLLLHYLLNLNIKNTFLAVFLSYFCAILSESTISFILVFVLNIELYCILNIPIYNFMAQLFGSILLYFIPVLVNKLKMCFLKINVKMSLKVTLIINFILGITTMVLETYMLSTHIDKIPLLLTLAIIISTFIYFIIAMYSLIRTNILEKTEEDLENEKIYNKTLTLLHDNIRGFKHDFNNIVQAIGGYVALNDMNGLKDYYQHLLEECKLTNNLNLLNPEAINNPSIYSLLTNKYFVATEKGITMKFSIFSDLSKINFNMYEISRIMGILLDNAIEAAEESKDKIVDIEFKSDNQKQLFIIKNTCKDTNISTTRIFEKGYSTKNRNSGFGLWNVHKILSKNTNLDLYTSIEDNMFSQQFAVYY